MDVSVRPLGREIVGRLALTNTEADFCDVVEQLAGHVCDAKEALFLVYDAERDRLISPRREGWHLAINEATLAGSCALFCETTTAESPSPDSVPGVTTPVPAAAAVPLRPFGSLSGVLLVAGPESLAQTANLEGLEELATLAGMLHESVVSREDANRLQDNSLDLLVRAVDGLPGTSPGHVNRVARLTCELALVLDLSSQVRQTLWQAAQYHDVGKLRLSERSAEERERFHPQAGASFLNSSRALRTLAPLVEAHHERYDGSGFPHGLTGDALPLEAWVLSLAEHVVEYPGAVEEFLAQEAAHHHPEAVEALRGLLESGRLPVVLLAPA